MILGIDFMITHDFIFLPTQSLSAARNKQDATLSFRLVALFL
jgi:hypothetical protein